MLAAFTQMFTQFLKANQSTAVSAAVAAVQAAKSKESDPKEDLWDNYLQEAEVTLTTAVRPAWSAYLRSRLIFLAWS